MANYKPVLERITNNLIINTSCLRDIGLYNGKMGISIFFFHYARYTGNSIYKDFAGDLLDEIYEDISIETPIALSDGVCGIGWGIIYLYQYGFITGDVAEALFEIDQKVMQCDLHQSLDNSLNQGLAGIALYVYTRMGLKDIKNPFDNLFFEKLKMACKQNNITFESYSLKDLMKKVEINNHLLNIQAWQEALLYIIS